MARGEKTDHPGWQDIVNEGETEYISHKNSRDYVSKAKTYKEGYVG